MGFHELSTRMALAAMRGEVLSENIGVRTKDELDAALVLQQVWFASLVGWMGGLLEQDEVVAEVERAVGLMDQDRVLSADRGR